MIGAAYSPSRPYDRKNPRRFAAHHSADLRGAIVIGAEADFDPNVMYFRHQRQNLELHEHSHADSLADFEEMMLKPDGTKTDLCKALSPVDLIRSAPADRAQTKLRAYYFKDFLTGTFETTVANAFGYGAIPPYDANGHDWRQWALLQSACADRGVSFSGKVWEVAEYGNADPDNGILYALREGAAETYTWMCDVLDNVA